MNKKNPQTCKYKELAVARGEAVGPLGERDKGLKGTLILRSTEKYRELMNDHSVYLTLVEHCMLIILE